MSDPIIFQEVAVQKPNRSFFDISNHMKFSCDPGYLIPVNVLECLPGDSFKIGVQSLIRFSPLISPLMDNVKAMFYSFYVPNRILWDQFEHAMTMTADDNTGNAPVFPYLQLADGNLPESSLADYLGLPQDTLGGGGTIKVSPFPFAAYQRIYYDYFMYRNDLPGDLTPDPGRGTKLVSGNNTGYYAALSILRKKGWNHDYFTSALTMSQIGAIVEVPLGDVYLKNNWHSVGGAEPKFVDNADTFATGPIQNLASIYSPGNGDGISQTNAPSVPMAYDPDGSLTTTPITINELRRVEHLQEFLELMARGGNRFTEMIKNFFNTDTGDARVQRAEYIGGTTTPVQISEVLNTTGLDGQLPQGNMSGHAAAAINGYMGNYHVKEHGYIITLMCVLPDTSYQQGVPKHFLRFSATDYFWRQFEGLGEQAVLNMEVCARFTSGGVDLDEWGYQPRHSEYKYINNRVAGLFKSSLKNWHWGRIFTTFPTLSPEFVEANPRTDIYAVTSGTNNKLWCHVANIVKVSRPMRKFTIPHI
ncbi:MAG: major capsid protein [Microvirus sp.]|nr:MAG: major capsid protein [Microvirus sp.]